MSHHRLLLLALLGATAVTACGGGSSVAPMSMVLPVVSQPSDGAIDPPTLSASTSTLAVKVSGLARHILITNSGSQPALNLAVMGTEGLPTTTAAHSDCAGTLNPGDQCTLTIEPGGTVSTAAMDTHAQPVTLTVAGSNTAPLALAIHVVNFGSVYQGGYVFDIDDTTSDTRSIGGKVLGLTPRMYEPWSETKPWILTADGQLVDAPPRPDFWDVVEGARSLTDGEANTRAIVAHMSIQQPPLGPQAYQAGVCSESNEGGQSGWYLPAICELAYDESDMRAFCGTKDAPLIPNNVRSRLADSGLLYDGGLLSAGFLTFMSSTENWGDPAWGGIAPAWSFALIANNGRPFDDAQISSADKNVSDLYRCVRKLTP